MPNNDLFCEKYLTEFEDLLNNGLDFKINNINKNVTVRIMLLICDAPAIAKVLNINQYNGRFCCIRCLHPTLSLYRSKERFKNQIDGKKNRRIYPYSNLYPLRNNFIYNRAVRLSLSNRKIFQGVKGSCWISKFLKIPEDVYFDPMHTCFLGPAEDLLFMWCKSARVKSTKTNGIL